jgi:glyoxylate/succinic semialdehyde reductase
MCSDEVAQPLPVAAAANEAFKAARAAGQGDADFSAVHEAALAHKAAASTAGGGTA